MGCYGGLVSHHQYESINEAAAEFHDDALKGAECRIVGPVDRIDEAVEAMARLGWRIAAPLHMALRHPKSDVTAVVSAGPDGMRGISGYPTVWVHGGGCEYDEGAQALGALGLSRAIRTH